MQELDYMLEYWCDSFWHLVVCEEFFVNKVAINELHECVFHILICLCMYVVGNNPSCVPLPPLTDVPSMDVCDGVSQVGTLYRYCTITRQYVDSICRVMYVVPHSVSRVGEFDILYMK